MNCEICNAELTQRFFDMAKNKQIEPKRKVTDKFICGCNKVTCRIHKWPNHECPLDYYEVI